MTHEVLTSNEIQLLTALGFVAAGAKLSVQAMRIFEALAQVRPNRAFPYVGMACVRMNREQSEEAVAVLDRGLRVVGDEARSTDPQELAHLYAWRGLALHSASRKRESELDLKRAHSLGLDGATASMVGTMLGLKTPSQHSPTVEGAIP